MLKRNHPFWGTPHRKPPILSGWWLTYPSKKYEFVSWDDDISQHMESHKIPWFQSPPTSISMISWIITMDNPWVNPRNFHRKPPILSMMVTATGLFPEVLELLGVFVRMWSWGLAPLAVTRAWLARS